MYCPNNYSICNESGICSCRDGHNNGIPPAVAGTLMAWAFIAALCAIFIVFVAFGVSAHKILSAPKLFDQQTGRLKFSGLEWFYLSPLTVGASTFMVAVGLGLLIQFSPFGMQDDTGAILHFQTMVPMYVFSGGMFLTLVTFAAKNWKQISNLIRDKNFFDAENKTQTVLMSAVTIITLLSIPAIVLTSATLKIKSAIKFNNRLEYLVGDYWKEYETVKGEGINVNVKAIDGNKIKLVQSDKNNPDRYSECEAAVNGSGSGTNDFTANGCVIIQKKGNIKIQTVSFRETDKSGNGKDELILFSKDTAYRFNKK